MRRVVVSGMGIVSSIGNNTQEVLASLREARSGIVFADRYKELGFRCQVHGAPQIDPEGMLDRRAPALPRRRHRLEPHRHGAGDPRFRAGERRGLQRADRPHHGVRRPLDAHHRRGGRRDARQRARSGSARSPCRRRCPRPLRRRSSTWFKIKGVNYSISSACATSNHCIGNAYEIIQLGKQDVIFAGGCEELDWTLSVLFDAMGAMSSGFNDTPAKASRAYDSKPRRLRHRRRRRRGRAGGARARQSARRQDLRRDRRLRRHLRRLRHGAALRRRRGALHEDGAGQRAASRSTTSTRTPPRRRSAT